MNWDNRIGQRSPKGGFKRAPTHYANGEVYSAKANPAPTIFWLDDGQEYFVILPVGMSRIPDERIAEFKDLVAELHEQATQQANKPSNNPNRNIRNTEVIKNDKNIEGEPEPVPFRVPTVRRETGNNGRPVSGSNPATKNVPGTEKKLPSSSPDSHATARPKSYEKRTTNPNRFNPKKG